MLGFFDFAMGFIYSMVLKYEILPDLKNYIEPEKHQQIQEGLSKYKFSLMDLDQNVMIPFMTGGPDLDSYYAYTSSWGQLHKIGIPTLFMSALDDPCICEETYPFKELESANPKVIAAFTKRGGHASHFTGGFRP